MNNYFFELLSDVQYKLVNSGTLTSWTQCLCGGRGEGLLHVDFLFHTYVIILQQPYSLQNKLVSSAVKPHRNATVALQQYRSVSMA